MQFDYPPIEAEDADLLLVTHEHLDHNGVEAVGGRPRHAALGRGHARVADRRGRRRRVRARPVGRDRARPNTIFVFTLDGVRVAHFGDFGQAALRAEQREAIGEVDMIFVPVGGGSTIGAEQAARIVEELSPRWVVPMHYRTERVSFLEPADEFLDRMGRVRAAGRAELRHGDLPEADEPLTVVPAAP